MVKRCHQCLTNLSVNSKEPLQQPPIPSRPWEKLGVDLFSLDGNKYLIITSYFTFTEVHYLKKNARATPVIKEMKKTFSRFGTPVEVVSNGGSQFKCKAFEDFSKEWAFQHTVSSPTHAQSNSKAEAAVKNVKNLLKKCGSVNHDEFWKGMLAIRNTPIPHSPTAKAQLNSYLAGHYTTFFLDFQILRKNFRLPPKEGKSCEPRTKRNCAMINMLKCFLLYNQDPVLQFVLALTVTGPFSGLFLKSDPTVPLLSKLTEDLCLSAIGINNVPFSCVLLTLRLLSSLEGRRCAA